MTLPSQTEIQLPLLQEIIAAGGEVKPADLYPRMRRRFPQITDADVEAKLSSTGGSLWNNRIQWARQHLVIKGEVYRQPRGLWRISPDGIARVDGRRKETSDGEPSAPHFTTEPAVTVVTDAVDRLCERLTRAQKQSSTPKNFEQVLAETFRFLDFEVEEQGRSGETDMVLNTFIGADSYRVVVDAKATHNDRIADNQINWLAIHQHQLQEQADHAAVVGIDYRGGNLAKWAAQYEVALIRTHELISVLQMHRQTPFSLLELRSLFAPPSDQQSMQNLGLIHQSTARHWKLLVNVVEQIANYNRFNRAGLVATADGIQLMLYSQIASRASGGTIPSGVPSTDEVSLALAFLATRAVGVLREAPPQSGQYHLTMHEDGAMRRIQALARYLEDSALDDASVAPATVKQHKRT
jgi:Mrr N-terminal domain/Restriction endonuclease